MTPLFAATQATQPGSGPVVPMAQGMLRATQQAAAFVATQGMHLTFHIHSIDTIHCVVQSPTPSCVHPVS